MESFLTFLNEKDFFCNLRYYLIKKEEKSK